MQKLLVLFAHSISQRERLRDRRCAIQVSWGTSASLYYQVDVLVHLFANYTLSRMVRLVKFNNYLSGVISITCINNFTDLFDILIFEI